MNRDNVAQAFKRVKEDMTFLKEELEKVQKAQNKKTSKKADVSVEALEKSIAKLEKTVEKHIEKTQNTFTDLAEELSEKITLEVNNLRMEMREEILELEQKTNYDGEDLY